MIRDGLKYPERASSPPDLSVIDFINRNRPCPGLSRRLALGNHKCRNQLADLDIDNNA
jgi:hypothetical protein